MRFQSAMRSGVVFAAVSAAVTCSAWASPITGQLSIGGYAQSNTGSMGTATGISFANASGTSVSGTSGMLSSYGAGTGSFASLGACTNSATGCGTIQDIASFAGEPATAAFLKLNTNGPTVLFDLSSITSVSHASDASGGSVTFTANGTIEFSGYQNTPGQFVLTAQGNSITSFSATTLASGVPAQVTPEPASFALLGTGLLGTLVAKMRRKETEV